MATTVAQVRRALRDQLLTLSGWRETSFPLGILETPSTQGHLSFSVVDESAQNISHRGKSGDTVAPPELVARGFLHDDDRLKDVLEECAAALDDLMDELGQVHVTGQRLIKEDIKEKLSELVYARTRRRPLIMPVVVEV